jgi:hypothetical protein
MKWRRTNAWGQLPVGRVAPRPLSRERSWTAIGRRALPETGYDLGPNDTMAHEWLGGRGATRPTAVDAAFH